MSKIENEKEMIAKFMGWIPDEDGWWRIVDNTYKVPVHDEMMMFDQSWESLMQVVDKIESLRICSVTIDGRFGCKIATYDSSFYINIGANKKAATYESIVQFIKWYNETINNNIK